jgi:hypothetical protein
MMRMPGVRALKLAMAGLVLAAGGCNTYKYFDIDVSFDPDSTGTGFDSTEVAQISTCRITVSGADSATSDLRNCPPPPTSTAPFEVGPFEYSSFASSGTMTFTVVTYTGLGQMDACKNGLGTVSIPVTGLTTIPGKLVIEKTGAGCSGTTPVGDGSTM